MQRGKKQGPFVGRRVQEVEDGVPLLYPRYTSVEDIVLDGTGAAAKAQQQPAAAAQDAGAGAAGSKRKAADADGIEPAAAAAGPQGDADPSEAKLTKQEKKRLKQERKARERAEQQQQAYGAHSAADTTSDQQQQPGGSNADADPAAAAAANTEEAQHIRSVLGFQGPAVNHSTGNFSFDFYAAVERETQEKLARIMAGDGSSKKHKKQQQQQQQQQQLPPPPKAAPVEAPAPAVAAAGSAGPSTAAPAAAGPGGYVPRRVFVGGMPYHYTEDKIREYWGWCGEVESIDLMTFPDSGRFRGIAFITFADEDGFHAALSCNGENLEGQTLKVDKCKAPNSKRATGDSAAAVAAVATTPAAATPSAGAAAAPAAAPAANTEPVSAVASLSSPPGKTPGYNVAYVGNIAFEVTPGELQALFEPYGVTKVRLHTDQHTGKSKGYAHVHFADEGGLDRAMDLSGHVLQGRGIKVSYGQPKKA